MHRLPLCAAMALVALASRGERIEAVYREDAGLVFAHTESLRIETDEVSVSVNGMELPSETVEEMGIELPSLQQQTSLRAQDLVLAVAEGRPTRVRRSFEQLRERSVENGEEQEVTGPLEGKTLVLVEEDDQVAAEVEGDEEVEELYLEGHRLTRYSDPLLPAGEVAIGDTWRVEDAALREFLGLGSGPVLFEPDEDEGEDEDPFDRLFEEESTVTAEIEFVEVEEREGLRCAVLAFTIDFQAELDDAEALGLELEEGMEEATGTLAAEIRGKGRLWYALAEGRPVAMEQALEGNMGFRFDVRMKMEEHDFQMRIEMACSVEGEITSTWSPPE